MKKPVISTAGTSEEWAYFESRWSDYIEATKIASKDDQGRHVETRQMTYVTDNSDKLFISREACISLGMISDSFPTIGRY